MIRYHFIDPRTMRYRDQELPEKGDLIEACFLYRNRHEKRFKIKGFIHDKNQYDNSELTMEEKQQWLLSVLMDEFDKFRDEDKTSREFQMFYIVENDKRQGILVIRDGAYKFHAVFMYTDLQENPLTYIEKFEEIAYSRKLPMNVLRIHLPVLWNETQHRFNVYRHGDTCRIRLIYSWKNEIWYPKRMDRVVRALKELNSKNDVWLPIKYRNVK